MVVVPSLTCTAMETLPLREAEPVKVSVRPAPAPPTVTVGISAVFAQTGVTVRFSSGVSTSARVKVAGSDVAPRTTV